MPCLTDEFLHAFLASDLSSPDEQRAADHLAECRQCRERANRLLGCEQLSNWRSAAANVYSPSDGEGGNSLDTIRLDLYEVAGATGEAAEKTTSIPSSPNAEKMVGWSGTAGLSRFKIDRKLGEGGFGVVYLAFDRLLRRQVAVKLPRMAIAADERLRARFLREAETAAQLHHPNIITVFEAGFVDDTPYLTAAFCAGPSLSEWLAENRGPMEPRLAAELAAQVSNAVEHAHRCGILHRDIKPGNILLEPAPGTKLGYVPKLSDFGMAKLMDQSGQATASSLLMGTPRYMAPEQASGRRDEVGPATDVYALGAVLYELLTGRPVVIGADNAVTLQRVLAGDPVRPRLIDSRVPTDLEAVCLKCLEKRPARRYASAAELEADLRRFLAGEATRARPLSNVESLRRWAVRHPAVSGLLATALLAWLIVSVGLFAYVRLLRDFNRQVEQSLLQTRVARERAEISEARLRKQLHIADVKLANRALDEGDVRQAAQILHRTETPSDLTLNDFTWRLLNNRTSQNSIEFDRVQGSVYRLQLTPDAKTLAACCQDGSVRFYDLAARRLVRQIATMQGEVNGLNFSPQGDLMATAGDDGTVVVWSWPEAERIRVIPAFEELAYMAAFSADGKLLITCGDNPVIRIWEIASGRLVGSLEGHRRAIEELDVSPNGKLLVSASSDMTIKLWDLDSHETLHTWNSHKARASSARFSPDGQFVAAGAIDGRILGWDLVTKSIVFEEEHLDGIQTLAFTNGGRLAVGDRGGVIRIWDFPTRSAMRPISSGNVAWQAHEGRVWSTIVGETGDVVSAGEDGVISVSQQPQPAIRQLFSQPDQPIEDVSLDDQHLAIATRSRGVQVLRLSDLDPASELSHQTTNAWVALEFIDNSQLLLGAEDGSVAIWPISSGLARRMFPTELNEPIKRLLPADGLTRVAAFYWDSEIAVVWQERSGPSPQRFAANAAAAALSNDGTRLSMTDGNLIRSWSIPSGREESTLTGHTSTVDCLAFSRDGSLLASGGRDRRVRIWSVATSSQLHELEGHRDHVRAVAFSPDGRTLASGDTKGRIGLWDVSTGTELTRVKVADSQVEKLTFSPDGNWLAAHYGESSVVLIDARPR